MSSVYKYSNSQEHLWIMNFVWYKTIRDCLYKFYMTMCTYINLIGNDRYIFKELVILGNAWEHMGKKDR